MGRFGGLFKKSDDKKPGDAPASNPYAQQQPAGQQSPAAGYNPYAQQNDSQYGSSYQAPPSGLPAGPRPGGLPSRVAPGPSRMDSWDSNGSAPPRYSEQPDTRQPAPSYRGGSSPALGGKSPALSSNYPSPSPASSGGNPLAGSAYPREKFGALDGVGRNRFDSPAPSPYNQSAPNPSQRQGGYGGLDTDDDRLLPRRNGPSNPAYGSEFQQPGGPGPAGPAYVDMSNMTEEERDEAEYRMKKAEIDEIRNQSEGVLDNSIANARLFLQRNAEVKASLQRQEEMLRHANQLGVESEVQVKRGDLNVKDLHDASGSMFKVFTARKRREKLDDERLRQELDAKQMREEARMLKQTGTSSLPQRKPPRTLGAQGDAAARRKQFALEEEDEEQEDRIDDKISQLSELVSDIHDDTVLTGQMIKNQDPLIQTMLDRNDRVSDKLITTHNRLNRIR